MGQTGNRDLVNEKARQRQFLGHSIGLWVLFTTEMWERFCYYGMRAFLVMYLFYSVKSSNPGFGWSEKEAYELYGWFTSLVYLFPILGGYIADRFIGQHRSVLWGGVLIALGEFCLFFTEFFRVSAVNSVSLSSSPLAWLTFMGGLGLIILGTGFFKPCISIMVGQLYDQNDSRKDVAFTIFYMGINLGALIAPFVAGTVAEKYGWHWGFLIAGIGMIFGLCTYMIFRPRYLGHIGMIEWKKKEEEIVPEPSGKAEIERSSAGLNRKEIDRVAVILVLSFFCIAFWAVFEQAGSSLSTFAKKDTNRQVSQSLAKRCPGIFIANEEAMDALIAFDNAKDSIYTASLSLEEIGKELTKAKDLLAKNGQNNSRLIQLAKNYDHSSRELQSTLESTREILKKASLARKKAGLDPLTINIPPMDQLLESGKKAAAEIDALAESRLSKEFAVLNTDSEKKEEIDKNRQKLKSQIVSEITLQQKKDEAKAHESRIPKENTIYTFPATWYQAVNPIGIVCFAPLFALLWSVLAKWRLDPSTPVKFGIGLITLSIAFMFMISGAIQAQKTGGNAEPYWLFITYIFCTWGELCLSPVGLSMVSKLAPVRYASLLMGVWLFSSAIANYVSAKLAAVLGISDASGASQASFFFGPDKGLADFFLILTLIPFIAGVIVFIFSGKLRKMMHEDD
ncbi:MAG: peptide MFS transporter [Planctomycetia bacterium]|nr:peptide MFS transporter [Planctomycetia bacterium]